MHALMIFGFIAVATAAPQYYYQQNAGSGIGAGSSNGAGSLKSFTTSFGNNVGHGSGNGFAGQASNFAGHGNGFGGSTYSSGSQSQPQQINHPVVYNKQIYIHSAPEDELLFGPGSGTENLFLKKNIRVVIVKAPENKGLTNAALQIAKSTTEDKTVVYVLNKQTDLGELQTQINQIQDSSQNKPEVHFITYKTPEEARHAESIIQAQYDALNGPTQVLDEGAASVDNIVGGASGNNGVGAATGNLQSTSNLYLPPAKH